MTRDPKRDDWDEDKLYIEYMVFVGGGEVLGKVRSRVVAHVRGPSPKVGAAYIKPIDRIFRVVGS